MHTHTHSPNLRSAAKIIFYENRCEYMCCISGCASEIASQNSKQMAAKVEKNKAELWQKHLKIVKAVISTFKILPKLEQQQ